MGVVSILRFMGMVKTWRTECSGVCEQLRSINDHAGQQQKIKSLDKLMVACRNQSELFSLLEVLTSVRLYRNLGRRISRITSQAIDQIIEARRLDVSERKSVQNEPTKYKKWDQFCGVQGECEGILCFITPVYNENRVSRTERLGNGPLLAGFDDDVTSLTRHGHGAGCG